MGEQRPWEKSYPPGVRWDVPIETAPLPSMFDDFTAKWGPKPALEYRDRRTSYAELRAAVDAVASGLMDLGVGPGTAVALYLPNTPWHPIAFFAVLRCGGRVVHLSPLDAERELAFKLKDSGARILVTTNIGFMALMAQKLKADGLVDQLIVADDTAFGPSADPHHPDPPGCPRRPPRAAARGGRQEAAAAMAEGRRGGHRGAAVHGRHHRQAQGRDADARQHLRHLLDLQAVGRRAEDLRARRGQGDLRPAAVSHLCADRRDAALPRRGQRADAAGPLRRGDHAPRHRGQEGDHLPRRADHVDRARQRAGHRQARPLVAALRGFRRRLSARGSGRALPEAHRPPHRRRLGHDGDLARRHGDAAGVDGQGGLHRPAAAGHRHGHRRARRPAPQTESRARRGRSASRGRTSPGVTGMRRKRRPRRSSTAGCSPATSAPWTRTATSISSTARRT